MVLRPQLHGRDVPHPQPAAHHHRPDIVGGMRFLIGDDEVLTVILGDTSDGLHCDGAPDLVGQVRVGHALRRQPCGVGDDLELAHVGALHLDAPHTGHAGD